MKFRLDQKIIEIYQPEYPYLKQEEAKMYMFVLGDGWRFPTIRESLHIPSRKIWDSHRIQLDILVDLELRVVPVREVN